MLVKVLTPEGIRWRVPWLCHGGCGKPVPLMKRPGLPAKWCSEVCRVRFQRYGTALLPKTCRCGEEFQPRRLDQVYCSERCVWDASNERRRGPGAEPRACAGCGVEWTPTANNSKAAYCSRRCYGAENKRRYRARLANAPRVEVVLTLVVMERDGWICQLCREPIDPELRAPDSRSRSVDHRVPLARGGDHTMDNCQAAHFGCNARKSHRLEVELGLAS